MTTKTTLLQTIRKHCLECCGNSYSEVEGCTAGLKARGYTQCALWIYRLGVDPEEPSEAMKEKGRKIAQIRKVKVSVQT
jgi:hypothetical protein